MSVAASVHDLLERMHHEVRRPVLNRDHLRDLTNELTAHCMVAAMPGADDGEFGPDLGLSRSEMALVQFMHRRQGKWMSRENALAALESARGFPRDVFDKTVDVYICKIRRKLAATTWVVETAHARGWRMIQQSESAYITPDTCARQDAGERDEALSREHILLPEALQPYFDALGSGCAMSMQQLMAKFGHSMLQVRARLSQLRYALSGYPIEMRNTVAVVHRRWQLVRRA